MTWQLVLTLLVVTMALSYLALSAWRTWRAKSCGGSCSCASKSAPSPPAVIPVSQLRIKRR